MVKDDRRAVSRRSVLGIGSMTILNTLGSGIGSRLGQKKKSATVGRVKGQYDNPIREAEVKELRQNIQKQVVHEGPFPSSEDEIDQKYKLVDYAYAIDSDGITRQHREYVASPETESRAHSRAKMWASAQPDRDAGYSFLDRQMSYSDPFGDNTYSMLSTSDSGIDYYEQDSSWDKVIDDQTYVQDKPYGEVRNKYDVWDKSNFDTAGRDLIGLAANAGNTPGSYLWDSDYDNEILEDYHDYGSSERGNPELDRYNPKDTDAENIDVKVGVSTEPLSWTYSSDASVQYYVDSSRPQVHWKQSDYVGDADKSSSDLHPGSRVEVDEKDSYTEQLLGLEAQATFEDSYYNSETVSHRWRVIF